MTPEEAQKLLACIDGTEATVLAELMDWKEVAQALETIAGLRYEYAVQVRDERWRTLGDAWTSEPEARSRYSATPGKNTGRVRIVRRLVSEPEVAE